VDISELADRFIREPGDVVKVGQIVQVHVLSVDAKTKRIALSMKKQGGSKDKSKGTGPVAVAQAAPSMEDKLAALADRWKRR
jgi:protein Tex